MGSLLSRRSALSGIGATVAAAAGVGVAASDAEAAQPTVRGTWLIRPTKGGPVGFHALAAFAAGGVFVTTGSDEAGTGLGEWISKSSNGFGFTYLNFHFDRAGKLATTVKVRAAGSFRGDRLSGHATETTLDPHGRRLHPDAHFKFTGKRVAVEAP